MIAASVVPLLVFVAASSVTLYIILMLWPDIWEAFQNIFRDFTQ